MQEILDLIEKKDFKNLKLVLQDMLVPDIASILEEIESQINVMIIFRLLPKELSAEVFSYISSENQEMIVNNLSNLELSSIMEELATDDAVDFIEEMPPTIVERVLKASTIETRKTINKFLSYNDDTAGAIMTPEFVKLDLELNAEQSIDEIRKQCEDAETINLLFITDQKGVLKGVISIKDLLKLDKSEKLKNHIIEHLVVATTNMDQEQIASLFSKYDFVALPVVDKENRIVGIVTVDDIIDVIREETTEDFQIMAAITPSDDPYIKTNVFTVWKKRVPWLLLLMISATFTSLIINTYEASLSAISPVLFACVPMIMDTGGNAGSQASVTVIRSLAVGELSTKDFLVVAWKEFRVSLFLGLTLAIACYAKLRIIDFFIFGFIGYTPIRCLVVSLALYITIVLAKLVGCMFPLLAKKCHLDPAVVASPFITTVVDATSLILYCLLAVAILA